MPARMTPSSASTLVDRIGQLQRDHRVGWQAEPAQPRGNRGNHPVGLRVSELARCAVGEMLAVRRIDERHRIVATHAGAAEQIVERGARRGALVRGIEDHAFVHQVSGR